MTETFYWDLNDATRAWTKRWHAERNASNKYPAMNQAGVYAGTLHYLKAVLALKSAADGKAVVAKMKECRPMIRCSARGRSGLTAENCIPRTSSK